MRKFLFVMAMPFILHAVDIPKSSLESVKADTTAKLAAAEKEHNTNLIDKYQAEVNELDKKIKKFELEWLEYRKHQLETKKTDPAAATELQELDKLIKARS